MLFKQSQEHKDMMQHCASVEFNDGYITYITKCEFTDNDICNRGRDENCAECKEGSTITFNRHKKNVYLDLAEATHNLLQAITNVAKWLGWEE